MFGIWSLWVLHGNMMFPYKVFHRMEDKSNNHKKQGKEKPTLLPVWPTGKSSETSDLT